MAPEQVHGLSLDQRADLFALGLVLFEALTGRAPYRNLSLAQRAATGEGIDLSALDELSLSDELKSVLSRALAWDREQRFASASAFLRELRRAGGDGVATA